MKAIFKSIQFDREVETKFGTSYKFRVQYDDKTASFLSKSKEQDVFKEGEENEFTETSREYQGKTYYDIKPIKKAPNSNFGRQLKKEQSKYSGFAMAYAKDLVVAGKVEKDKMFTAAKQMFDWMVEQDKAIENG